MATVAAVETGVETGVETDETSDDDSSLDNACDYIDGMEDFFGEDAPGSYWLSDDQLAELMLRGPTSSGAGTVKIPPPLLDWALQDPHEKPMQVTFGKARRSLWEQFKKEHGLFINNVKKLETPSVYRFTGAIDRVYQFLLGPSSSMAKIFYDRLGISEQKYVLFIMTYLKSCCYRMSVKNLNDNADPIVIMDTVAYNEIWTRIA